LQLLKDGSWLPGPPQKLGDAKKKKWIAQLLHCIMDLQIMEVPDHANTHPIPMIVAEISQFF